MITVEELIVQSLYHRLVVVQVRRTGDPKPQEHSQASGQQNDGAASPNGDQAAHGAWTPPGPSHSATLGPGLGIDLLITLDAYNNYDINNHGALLVCDTYLYIVEYQ